MNSNYLQTTVTLSLTQRLGRILSGTVILGYSASSYESTTEDMSHQPR